jgi:hypothetical protein
MDSQMNKATLPPRSFAPTYLATMEPKMSWRAYFRIVANFILSMVVAIIVGNLLALRLALHPTDAEKAAKLNELVVGDAYTAHPSWWIGIIVLVALMLRDIANGINRTN